MPWLSAWTILPSSASPCRAQDPGPERRRAELASPSGSCDGCAAAGEPASTSVAVSRSVSGDVEGSAKPWLSRTMPVEQRRGELGVEFDAELRHHCARGPRTRCCRRHSGMDQVEIAEVVAGNVVIHVQQSGPSQPLGLLDRDPTEQQLGAGVEASQTTARSGLQGGSSVNLVDIPAGSRTSVRAMSTSTISRFGTQAQRDEPNGDCGADRVGVRIPAVEWRSNCSTRQPKLSSAASAEAALASVERRRRRVYLRWMVGVPRGPRSRSVEHSSPDRRPRRWSARPDDAPRRRSRDDANPRFDRVHDLAHRAVRLRKSTVAGILEGDLRDRGHRVEVLDGDVVRTNLTSDLGSAARIGMRMSGAWVGSVSCYRAMTSWRSRR